ncbi:carbohydrate kinase family protein [Halanaerobium kushneri]|uniref:Sugar or nucleoside kinase, ribokinase family n=1 Tax=Halanaerobium kushneri TaxID=56779 RepID=A0A1N6R238_9FIRM|nr:carbohydrate kinase family protein [Halanaerobium kushneri]SIQ22945.1 Sugar or nucleoside kinase, ribokinase family [Halanaerobium kushneri]
MTEKILLVGEIFFDTIYKGLENLPSKGQEIFCSDYKTSAGGMAITAVGMSRLGLDVELAGAVGSDVQGEYLINKLKQEEVGIKYLKKIEPAVTNNSTAIVYDGDRSFISYRGIEDKTEQILQEIAENNNPNNFTRLHISLAAGNDFMGLIKKISKMDLNISLVTGWNAAEYYGEHKDEFEEIMHYTDIFFCNELEAKKITGFSNMEKACRYLNTISTAVVTLGEKGAITYDNKQGFVRSSALKVEFKDPTGAGDSFIAAYTASINCDFSLLESLKIANVCASLSTRELGGIDAFPQNMNEAKKYLN